ncbi:MAG TPA: choice-of-anchor Q domain-containing protein [Rudaea sp.]|nr:choice-of-anchor Q domain-containing protein [Rudaea sp.]
MRDIRKSTIRLAVGLLAGIACANAGAVTFCVHNSAELGSALFSAESNGSSDSIRLVGGTYTLNGPVHYQTSDPNESLSLSGGWSSSCLLHGYNPANTMIDGTNAWNMVFSSTAAISFDAIRFHRIAIFTVSAKTASAKRNLFTGTQNNDVVQFSSDDGSIILDSNVFNGKNTVIRTFNGTSNAPSLEWDVINNTFVNAQADTSGTYLRNGYGLLMTTPGPGSNIHMVIANNIAWGNSNGGVHIDGQPSVLATHNQWQSFQNADNAPLASGSGANSTNDPQLDAALHPIAPGSPAINSGTVTFPGGIGAHDAGGGPRQIGSLPDRGAFESLADDEATITVTTSADSGTCPSTTNCSLRGALTAAAAAGNAQRIAFDIGGACPRTINVNSALPAIVDALTIDGYSQPGAQTNSLDAGNDARLCIVLNGNYTNSRGLLANASGGQMIVKGLAFENFTGSAIEISNGADHIVQGNQFGGRMNLDGGDVLALAPNARNINISNLALRVLVGGADVDQRNVIDAGAVYGIALAGTGGFHVILNNTIGLNPDGITAAGNNVGIIVQSDSNIIQSNHIAASTFEGVRLQSNAAQVNVLVNNVIGLPELGVADVGNGGAGVRITDYAMNNRIGATASGVIIGNEIAGNGINGVGGIANGDGGIRIDSGISNRISGNRIYANYGINIDLGADGPTANDADDSDTGANQLQNYPQPLRIVHGDNGLRTLRASLYATRSQLIEVFGAPGCGSASRGDAGAVVGIGGRPLLSPIGGGLVEFSVSLGRGPGTGADRFCALSMTATSLDVNTPALGNNTSELSECLLDDTIFAHGFDVATGWSCAP